MLKKFRDWFTWKKYWYIQGTILAIMGLVEWFLIGNNNHIMFLIGAWAFFGIAVAPDVKIKQD